MASEPTVSEVAPFLPDVLESGEADPEEKARTASFHLGSSSYEIINTSQRSRGSINSSGSELGVSPGRTSTSPPSVLKISMLGGRPTRSSKRKRNVSFAGTQDPPKTQLDLKEAGSVVKPGRATGGQSALGSSGLQDELREDVYILYEEEGEEEGERGEGKGAGPDEGANGDTLNPSFIRSNPGRCMSPSNSVYSVVSTGGGIIDGRFSFSAGTPAEGFVAVEAPADYGPASISIDLQVCKKTVLKPYLFFLKVIGWRKLRDDRGIRSVKCPRLITFINFTYPAFIFTTLLLANISQILTCFYRDQPIFLNDTTAREPLVSRPITVNVSCKDNLLTKLIFPDVLLMVTYLCGLYIFRYGEPEHLAAIMETVFLSANAQHVKSRKRRLIFVLRSLLVLGAVWFIYDFLVNIGRGFSLQVFYRDARIGFLKGTIARYFFVAFSLLGFVFFDMVYLSVIVTYASQSELIQFYIMGIIDKVTTKAYSLEEAMKDIQRTYDYLRVMNGKLATLTTLCLLIFVEALISSLSTVLKIQGSQDTFQLGLSVAVGFSSVILWTLLILLPLAQASRLTSKCRKLRRLGVQIRSRPFIYSDTPQLDLDSFLQYTNATRYTAKLAGVPIYPALVYGGLFVIAMLGSFLILSSPTFQFAPWF